ncbi:hypothetical protein MCAG_03849 [Micromonospora sp. ATCC 39149]|uniref:hypothetical protein n=1 Tax=Micromonospora sp. (strain ATCC 39149 / NRRL 15099 / SCC 1413) TaxID=219305 RepID=UPI0001A5058A|nr:hypothetical protein [Micromonospora sp. ATCC 39149]EEP73522.1 hypothetical protein MCAG_03849 [Micromonospora sp. ATCC 39149]
MTQPHDRIPLRPIPTRKDRMTAARIIEAAQNPTTAVHALDLAADLNRARADRDRYARTAADLLRQRNTTAEERDRIEAERDDLRVQLGRAEADNRAMMRDRDEVIRERDKARATTATAEREHGEALEQLTQAWAALNAAGYAHPSATVADLIARCAADRDEARAELKDVLHDLRIAVGPTYSAPSSAAVEAVRQISEARAELTRTCDALARTRQQRDRYVADPPPGSVGDRAQGIRPADWEQRAADVIADDLIQWGYPAANPMCTRIAASAVRALIDAGLAGPGGRCRKCGDTYPRTLPAGQDPLCWTCDSEEVVGLPECPATTREG